jgi:hypothetical protein
MFEFLRKLVSGAPGESSQAADPVAYNDFQILPTPSKSDGGWRIQALITKEMEGEVKTHEFIRADTVGDRQGAIDMTISKAKRTIDEQGERIFRGK